MKTTQTIFKFFTVPEWEKEQDFLREQHKSGWKFTKVTGLGLYHFEACPPEDVIYQLDYNPDRHREEYLQMFRDCGWEFLQEYAGYTYFRKPAAQMQGNEGIFCDDESRLDMMKRVLKGRLTPLLILFCLCLLPQLVLFLINGRYSMALLVGSIVGLYLYVFCWFGYHYRKYRNRLEQ